MSDFSVNALTTGKIGKAENSLPPCPDHGDVFSWKDELAKKSIFTVAPQFGTGTTAFQG